VIPLVWFCSQRSLMGPLRAPAWQRLLAWGCAVAIVLINGSLLLSLAGLLPWAATA
jgi:Mn2+/Fe2+ NRAMP family transporter